MRRTTDETIGVSEGVGVDAQVALEFHEQREQTPGLFVSQFVNKLWYSQVRKQNVSFFYLQAE
jgi:hypothetical protein